MAAYILPGIFVMGCLVYLMESYVIRCPEQAEWNIRAEIRCQNTTTYFCLYNYIAYSYEEGCTGPDWDRSGSKRVYSRNFNRAPCNDTRYQPIKFVTNGNSDCIFRKSLCTDEGQILFSNGTTETDSTCRCDYKQGYAFVTVPRNKCSCQPSEEDCSCYLKKCLGIGYYLSSDYECTKDITNNTDCPSMSANPSEDPHIDMVPPGTPSRLAATSDKVYQLLAHGLWFSPGTPASSTTKPGRHDIAEILLKVALKHQKKKKQTKQKGTPRADDSYVIKRTCDVAILVSIFFLVIIVITICALFHQRLPRCPCLFTNQYGNRLKEIVSENNGYIQIGLSSENQKSAVDELKDNIEKEATDTVLKHLDDNLNNWRNEPVKLAVTGKSGVGKSSFINAIRNLNKDHPDFATSSCSGNTTKQATKYKYPGNPKITLHDLPGYGTAKLPTNDYVKTMKLHKYDYILIFVGNIEETDLDIAKKLKEMEKPFCFVRSKIDIDILNAKNDGELEKDAVENIILKSLHNLEDAKLSEAKLFVISNHNRKIYEFNDLVSYIQRNLPALKCDVVMFSLSGEFTDDVIDNKYQLLKNRLLKVSVVSVDLNTGPISCMDRVLNIELIVQELWLYHKAYGFEQQSVKDILKVDYIREKLNANSIIEIQAAEAMREFVDIELRKLRKSETRGPHTQSIHSVMGIWPGGEITFIFLNQVLKSCRDDAQLVYFHIRNVDV